VNCIFIRQSQPLGLGHAVLCAKPVVGTEPFAVLLADDFMDVPEGEKSVMAQMTEVYEREGLSVLAVQDVPRADTRQYGIVSASQYQPGLERVNGIVEKPDPDSAPSTLAVVGRYVLSNRIFECIENLGKGAGGEIQLTDAMAKMIGQQPFHAVTFSGERFDCGGKVGFVEATLALALRRQDMGAEVRRIAERLLAARTS
jgi:UTP--glucose-1-phosphate uridylyltransferase